MRHFAPSDAPLRSAGLLLCVPERAVLGSHPRCLGPPNSAPRAAKVRSDSAEDFLWPKELPRVEDKKHSQKFGQFEKNV